MGNIRSVLGWAYLALGYTFIFLPVVVLVLFSFTSRDIPLPPFEGPSLQWYQRILGNDRMVDALISVKETPGTLSRILSPALRNIGRSRFTSWMRDPGKIRTLPLPRLCFARASGSSIMSFKGWPTQHASTECFAKNSLSKSKTTKSFLKYFGGDRWAVSSTRFVECGL